MNIPFVRSALVSLFLAAAPALPAAGQTAANMQTEAQTKARCLQLIAFFDRYGASRSEHSDGARNHYRIGAEIDCTRKGRCEEALVVMEDVLRRKKFDLPPAIGLAEAPAAKARQ